MIKKADLYKKILAFLLWIQEDPSLKHPSLKEFTDGMKLLIEGVSADVEIWMDWEKLTLDEIPEEDAFDVFKSFLQHWIQKKGLNLFDEILYKFDPDDFDYNEKMVQKWESLLK